MKLVKNRINTMENVVEEFFRCKIIFITVNIQQKFKNTDI